MNCEARPCLPEETWGHQMSHTTRAIPLDKGIPSDVLTRPRVDAPLCAVDNRLTRMHHPGVLCAILCGREKHNGIPLARRDREPLEEGVVEARASPLVWAHGVEVHEALHQTLAPRLQATIMDEGSTSLSA